MSNTSLAGELNFWLEIMGEHALFLRLALPPAETNLIHRAADFEKRYASLRDRLKSPNLPDNIASEALNLTLEFVQFKTLILDRAIECRLVLNNVFPLQVDHLRREALHFVFNLIRYQNNEEESPAADLLHNEVFWLRIMADHAKFIKHLLDPSQRRLIMTAQAFSDTFDLLRCQAEDFQSMLAITPRPIPSLLSFARETLQAARDIRQFKAQAARQLAQCNIWALTTPLLLEHLRKETDKFIKDIEANLEALESPFAPHFPFPAPEPGPCPQTETAPAAPPEPDPPALEPTAEEFCIESPLKEKLAVPPQPLVFPSTGFIQPGQTRIKIKFTK